MWGFIESNLKNSESRWATKKYKSPLQCYTPCFNSNLSSSFGRLWIIFNVFQKAFDFSHKGMILNTILIKYDNEGICHEELPITFKFECIQVQMPYHIKIRSLKTIVLLNQINHYRPFVIYIYIIFSNLHQHLEIMIFVILCIPFELVDVNNVMQFTW